jgi:hypothetical protein
MPTYTQRPDTFSQTVLVETDFFLQFGGGPYILRQQLFGLDWRNLKRELNMQTNQSTESSAEQTRLQEYREGRAAWKKWGPYLSERQWGTVREDYSSNGDAWNYFPHDMARSRAYRWGEDGIAGISDDKQLLCFALALWNGNDPILKERLFGLTQARTLQPDRG